MKVVTRRCEGGYNSRLVGFDALKINGLNIRSFHLFSLPLIKNKQCKVN